MLKACRASLLTTGSGGNCTAAEEERVSWLVFMADGKRDGERDDEVGVAQCAFKTGVVDEDWVESVEEGILAE